MGKVDGFYAISEVAKKENDLLRDKATGGAEQARSTAREDVSKNMGRGQILKLPDLGLSIDVARGTAIEGKPGVLLIDPSIVGGEILNLLKHSKVVNKGTLCVTVGIVDAVLGVFVISMYQNRANGRELSIGGV